MYAFCGRFLTDEAKQGFKEADFFFSFFGGVGIAKWHKNTVWTNHYLRQLPAGVVSPS